MSGHTSNLLLLFLCCAGVSWAGSEGETSPAAAVGQVVTPVGQVAKMNRALFILPRECGGKHEFYFGSKSQEDELLYVREISKEHKVFRNMNVYLNIPGEGEQQLGNIRYIEVFDQVKSGNGGCVFLAGGGVGANYVTLRLVEQHSGGIEFLIRVYGRKSM